MAHTNVNYLIPIVLTADGVITVADDWDQQTIDFDCIIWRVSANLGCIGTTSGNNDFVVEKNGATDLWTVASGCGRIAYNASAKYLEWDWENANMTGYASGQLYPPSGCRISAGDYLRLNVNAVAGAGNPAGLKVTLWVKPVVD
jgi:hypothetical protein